MRHAERRKQIDLLAREIAPYMELSRDHQESARKSVYQKLYAQGLSETAVRSWWRAIEARAAELNKPLDMRLAAK